MAGWDGDKSDKSRKMLSDLKMLFTQYNDLCLRYITEQYHLFLNSDEQVMFVHIREPDEIARFVAVAPEYIKTLLIYRSGTERVYGNQADDNVLDYPYDITFDNSSKINEAKKEFLLFFEDVFKRYSFDTGPSKTLEAKFDNGQWDVTMTTKYQDGKEKTTSFSGCDISITTYAKDGHGIALKTFTQCV